MTLAAGGGRPVEAASPCALTSPGSAARIHRLGVELSLALAPRTVCGRVRVGFDDPSDPGVDNFTAPGIPPRVCGHKRLVEWIPVPTPGPLAVPCRWHDRCSSVVETTGGLMARIARIMVPTDFSAPADAALDYARDLARQFGASIDLVHVFDDPFASGAFVGDGTVVMPFELREAAE